MRVRVFVFTVLLKAALFAAAPMLPESTVAVVNGVAISEDEVEREVSKLLPRTYIHTTVDDKKLELLKEKALESLIESSLLYAYALSKGIEASRDEVEDIFESFQKLYGTRENFKAVLKQSNFTENSFKTAIKKEETLKKLYKKEIEVLLSDEDLKKHYEVNKDKYLEPERIKIRLIYVENDPSDINGKQKAVKKIEEAQEMLKKGESFEYVAQEYSNDKTRVMGGDMGYLHRGMLEPTLEEIAFGMKEKEVSGIIERDVGYYIIKVEQKSPRNQLSFENVKSKLAKELKGEKEDKRKKKLLERLFSTATIVK